MVGGRNQGVGKFILQARIELLNTVTSSDNQTNNDNKAKSFSIIERINSFTAMQ